ncbi:MAG: caspase family protein [Chlorobi bacterium]|nr:caspase family protein [Chlorobiota bacterium]
MIRNRKVWYFISLMLLVSLLVLTSYAQESGNPMGKTWVFFIENSNYKTFATIEGPQEDINIMREALTNYRIDKIIEKKDLDKKGLEFFFTGELKTLIAENNISSILIWYAGHGKVINDISYWIPIDAERDNESTYFNVNSLKESIQAFSDKVKHILIVSDACETGPSFYQAMRATIGSPSCDDKAAVSGNSKQVFTSSGYELTSGNSYFTSSFAKSLSMNSNPCIPIETIVSKVTEDVVINNSKMPKFGNISGFDEGYGTFFFIKK